MAFPSTGVIDNFNRADAANLGANWTDDTAGLKITSNKAAATATSTEYLAHYNVTTYGGSLECFVTLSLANTTAEIELWALDGSLNGYRITFLPASSVIRVRRKDAGVSTQLGADISQAIGLTDQIGFSRVAGVITVYINGVSVGTRNDSTYATAASLYLDFYAGDTLSNAVDNFGGGTSATVTPSALTITSSLGSAKPIVTKLPAALSVTSNLPTTLEQVTKIDQGQTIQSNLPAPTLSIVGNKTVQVNALTITSNLPSTVAGVKKNPAAQTITSNQPTTLEKVTLTPAEQIIIANLPAVTTTGAVNKTVVVQALTIQSSVGTATPSVTKQDSGQSIQSNLPTTTQSVSTTFVASALTITSAVGAASKEIRSLPNGITITSLLGGVTPRVAKDISSFQIIASLPGVTISGGSVNKTVSVNAIVIRALLGSAGTVSVTNRIKATIRRGGSPRISRIVAPKRTSRITSRLNITKNENQTLYSLPLYLGQFSTRACIMAKTIASGTANKIETKTRHFARANVTAFKIGYPNWYVNDSLVETGNGGTATITAAIEYPIGGTITQVKWSGASSTTVASGAQSALSDWINLTIPSGDAFIVRTYFSNPSGILIYQTTGEVQLDTANGEQARRSSGALTDETMNAGAYVSGSSTTDGYGPNVLVAMISTPSVCILGDSRQQGIQDTYVGDSSTDKGEVARSIGPYFPYINMGKSALGAGNFVSSHTRQLALSAYCSHIVCALGFNDLSGQALPVATVQASILTIAGYFPTKPFFQCTLPPKTTSTDSWATTANQTSTAGVPNVHIFNNWVRAGGLAGIDGYFEFADTAEGTRDSGKWIANGTANYYTADGLHEKQTLNVLYKTNRVIDPSLIRR
jgi:hypothetical protein